MNASQEYIYGFLYLYCRVLGSVALLPFFSGISFFVPRVFFALAVAGAFSSRASLQVEIQPLTMMSEFVFGSLLTLPLSLLCAIAGGLAELFDAGRGQTIAAQYSGDGSAPAGTSEFGMRTFVWTVLVLSGGLELLLLQIATSFDRIPAGTASLLVLAGKGDQTLQSLVPLVSDAFSLYLPVAFIFLSVDIVAAFCQLILPAVPLHIEAFVVKTCVGSFLIFLLVRNGAAESILLYYRDMLDIAENLFLR